MGYAAQMLFPSGTQPPQPIAVGGPPKLAPAARIVPYPGAMQTIETVYAPTYQGAGYPVHGSKESIDYTSPPKEPQYATTLPVKERLDYGPTEPTYVTKESKYSAKEPTYGSRDAQYGSREPQGYGTSDPRGFGSNEPQGYGPQGYEPKEPLVYGPKDAQYGPGYGVKELQGYGAQDGQYRDQGMGGGKEPQGYRQNHGQPYQQSVDYLPLKPGVGGYEPSAAQQNYRPNSGYGDQDFPPPPPPPDTQMTQYAVNRV